MLNHIVISLGFFSMVATWDLTLLHVNDIHMRMEETNKYSSNCKQKDMKAGEYTIIWLSELKDRTPHSSIFLPKDE